MNQETQYIRQILHQHFPQLDHPELQEKIAEIGSRIMVGEGEIIMDVNSYIKMVPLIIKGSIKVSREDEHEAREMILYFLGPGDTCSMSFSCCMTDKKSAIRTQAMEATEFIGIPVEYVDDWMNRYPSWKNFVMLNYDRRLMELVKVIDSIAFAGMDARLQKYLQARKESSGSALIKATHQEIAYDLNASREAVSRLLKKLETMGLVELGRNQIKVLERS